MNVKVYNQTGKEVEEVALPDAVFGLKWNASLVHQVVTGQMANMRSTLAHAKPRSEVRGGGKKPWKQKGTGRARHGSIRSPLWKGGGVTHGPLKEKDYTKKVNKKMAKKALYTVLSAKARDNEIVVIDDLQFPEAKTKLASKMFVNLAKQKALSRMTKGNGVLVALSTGDRMSRRVMKNLPYASIDEARNLNAYEVLQYKYVLFPKSIMENFK